ncbi:reverse transcriptase family protein [Emticicia agri]|uniref:RNA-directed DNA polymerase n=1 Tax=Emticicia agri TaxID=2492393 RepID=A0A4Q5M0S6_9BACT|nr:reverse transcriptase family protein [Emticicia agri]RYU95768.1 RNA-directed DNA polymerase [Emticicia agri]
MTERLTRQEIYDRIRATSRDEFILSEMKKLGFWPSDEEKPSVSEQLIKHEGELSRELQELSQKQRKFDNQQAMLAEMRKARMAAAKKKRVETKEKNEQKRKDKAEQWKQQKQNEIVYLGEDVSHELNNTEADTAKLAQFGLPHFADALALATAMNISLGKLRFLAYNRKVSTTTHYKRFYLAKKTGGKRLISAPMPKLKEAQYWILDNILYKLKNTDSAHGFVPQRSILTNASNHIGQDVVINIDLKDFFPSIDYKRIKGLFAALGYSKQIASILALVCAEPDVDMIDIDKKTYYVAHTERKLPQGAPTSPAITNLICYKLDHRFEGIARKFNFNYSRYADDITFSAKGDGKKLVGQVLWAIRQIIESEGFQIHPDKLAVMRKGRQQEVTGIVVNDKPGIDRKELRRFRALLHQIELNGTEGKSWRNGVDLENSMRGYASFVGMVKPEQGIQFKAQLDQIFGVRAKVKPVPAPEIKIVPPTIQDTPPKPDNDEKPWWEII